MVACQFTLLFRDTQLPRAIHTLPKYLSRQQVEQYHEQGFLAPIDVMPEDEAGNYLQRLQAAEAAYPDDLSAENRNNPHLAFEFLDDLVRHPLILDVVEDLIGPDFALWGSVLFIKEPQSSHFVSWHQDATYMGLEPHDFVTPWLALSPSNRELGCMRMIPGSHRDAIQPHDETFHENNILTRGQQIHDVDESVAVDLVLKPGQMSLHHARTIHGSRPNRGTRRRADYAMQAYVPAPARQLLGDNLWIPMRGEFMQPDCIALERPGHDMDPFGRFQHGNARSSAWRLLLQPAGR